MTFFRNGRKEKDTTTEKSIHQAANPHHKKLMLGTNSTQLLIFQKPLSRSPRLGMWAATGKEKTCRLLLFIPEQKGSRGRITLEKYLPFGYKFFRNLKGQEGTFLRGFKSPREKERIPIFYSQFLSPPHTHTNTQT